MDPPNRHPHTLLAPSPANAAARIYAPSSPTDATHAVLPAVDDYLITDNDRLEVHDGVIVEVLPANPPHAEAHHHVSSVVGSIVRDEYTAATDVRTRVGPATEFAPDVSIYPTALDENNHHQMTEVAFEIADTQTRSNAQYKADRLCKRGCRRVFLIDVSKSVLCEFDPIELSWIELAPDTLIEDRTFLRPVLARQLLERFQNDALVLACLEAKGSAALDDYREAIEQTARLEGVEQGIERGIEQGALMAKRNALQVVLNARFSCASDERVSACASASQLDAWLLRALRVATFEEVFHPLAT